jgi:FkbM family methyltransferase
MAKQVSAKDPDITRYRDYSTVAGIGAADHEFVFKLVAPGLALRLDYALILKRLFDARGIVPRGVIHLGGHHGEELLVYAALGFTKVLSLEPDPDSHAILEKAARFVERTTAAANAFLDRRPADPLQIVTVNVAASDGAGTATLHRTAHSAANSMFKPESDKEWMQVTGTVEIKTDTVDNVLRGLPSGWAAHDFNMMRLNIQGAEVLAFKGAREALKHMDLVYAEVNFDDRYVGSPPSSEVEGLLASHGFVPIERYRYIGEFDAVGDILFVRK